MIKTKSHGVNSDGVELTRTYSDLNMMIEREGVTYSEAIDPTDLKREYIETDIPIMQEEPLLPDA